MLGDTIAAVSTPRGKGGVALIRVSGAEAKTICDRIFLPKSGKKLSESADRKAIYGQILAPDESGNLYPVDDGLSTVFSAPASFTGEDTVEICCHGGILLTETVLSAVFFAGAKPAEAGEFTKRAFINGKLGLSAAEALGNMLEAKTKHQLTLAHNGMGGKTERQCLEVFEKLRDILAAIYARIDYPDEDLSDLTPEEMDDGLSRSEALLQKLLFTYSTGRAIAEGIPTVICGKPNVGKSSLYNGIVGRDAAIVTDVEGTTRDILSETVGFGKVTLRLFDTAGLHSTENRVERIGIDRAKETIENAELIFALFDGSRAPTEEDFSLMDLLSSVSAKVIAVLNKSDCGIDPGWEDLCRDRFSCAVSLSAASGEGIETLISTVETAFINEEINIREDAVLTNARQNAAVLSALERVRDARNALASGSPIELCCNDVEAAMGALSELDGRNISEEIVAQIFSHFCVGK